MFWKEKLHRLNCFAASFHIFLYCLLSFAADSDGRNSREQSRTDADWFSRPHSTKGGPLKGSLVLCQYLLLKCSGFCLDFVLDFVLKLTHDYFRGRIVRRGPFKGSQVVLCQYPISGSSWLWKFYQHKRPSLRSHTWCCHIRASCPIMDIKRADIYVVEQSLLYVELHRLSHSHAGWAGQCSLVLCSFCPLQYFLLLGVFQLKFWWISREAAC